MSVGYSIWESECILNKLGYSIWESECILNKLGYSIWVSECGIFYLSEWVWDILFEWVSECGIFYLSEWVWDILFEWVSGGYSIWVSEWGIFYLSEWVWDILFEWVSVGYSIWGRECSLTPKWVICQQHHAVSDHHFWGHWSLNCYGIRSHPPTIVQHPTRTKGITTGVEFLIMGHTVNTFLPSTWSG